MADPELVDRVAASTGLDTSIARRLVDDVIAYHQESAQDYVRRRHAHLQTYGRRNEEIFDLLATELADRVFAAPALTARQLRRIVYG